MALSTPSLPHGGFFNPKLFQLWLGTVCATLGDAVAQVVLVCMLLAQSSSQGSDLALFMVFTSLPTLLFGTLTGWVSDRMPRTFLLLAATVGRIGIMALVALTLASGGKIPPAGIFTLAFALGVGSTVFQNGRQGLLPELVGADTLPRANAWVTGSVTIVLLLGAVVTGLYVNVIGLSNLILGVLGVYGVGAALCVVLAMGHRRKVVASESLPNMSEFVQYLKAHPRLRRLLWLSAGISLLIAGFFNTMNAVGVDTYHLGLEGLSRLKLMLGVGMVVGTLIMVIFAGATRWTYWMAYGFLTVCVFCATSGAVTTYDLAWIWLVAIGMANAILNISLETLIQRVVPNRYRGKAFGVNNTLSTLAFLGVSGLLSLTLSSVSPWAIFHGVSGVALAFALLLLLTDDDFRHFVLRLLIVPIFQLFFPVRILGAEHLPKRGPMLLAGNHTGWLDTLFLTVACPRPIWFLAFEGVYQLPGVGPLCRYLNVLPIPKGRGLEALSVAVQKALSGELLCIFPEGKLSVDGQMAPFQRGVSRLQHMSRLPIVPFAIVGGYEAWPVNRGYPWPTAVTVVFGPPIAYDPEMSEKPFAKDLQGVVARLIEQGQGEGQGQGLQGEIVA